MCGAAWMAYQNGIVPTAGDYVTLVFSATFGRYDRKVRERFFFF